MIIREAALAKQKEFNVDEIKVLKDRIAELEAAQQPVEVDNDLYQWLLCTNKFMQFEEFNRVIQGEESVFGRMNSATFAKLILYGYTPKQYSLRDQIEEILEYHHDDESFSPAVNAIMELISKQADEKVRP